MTACTLDIICETAMGVSINAQDGQNIEYVRAVHEIEDSFMYRFVRPWLHSDFIFKWTSYGKRYMDNIRRVQALTKKETLRLYPIVPFIARECYESFTVCKYRFNCSFIV
ncbi:cytochrome P450 4V2 [Nephila pilipes]|uniref:Cytochrome P450 4V2 n=1 Tax=Nephila pilipes TaxID=299642 RepID=A0A8X6PP70_NEPPI|nr:cytochrome P450 4V2 [Nephila pilipes]